MKTLYLLIGNIGSGKSTWAKEFVKNNPKTKIVSADKFREMFTGEYKYEAGLDDVIDDCMVSAINRLLWNSFDVIVDVCNLFEGRRNTWLSTKFDKKVAVIFPAKDKEWHVKNRLKNSHTENTDWGQIYEDNVKSFQKIDETQFDEVINIESY